jgi:hypothetical protein
MSKRIKDFSDNFWGKVDIGGPDDCWEWKASRIKSGYGQIWKNGRIVLAHRMSYILSNGDIPDGLCKLHKETPLYLYSHRLGGWNTGVER